MVQFRLAGSNPTITQQYINNSLNIMFSDPLTSSLDDKLFQWKRKMEQTTTVKNVIDVYSFTHIVALLQIYEDVEKNKETIQQVDKYRPKRKARSVEWIFKYMAEQIGHTLRYTKKIYTGALRLKGLYEKGVTFNMLIHAGCMPTDFFVAQGEYEEFLAQLSELENTNNSTPASADIFFRDFINSLSDHLNDDENN